MVSPQAARARLRALVVSLLACGLPAVASAPALAQEPVDTDVLQEYRITGYPSYRINDELSGFGYVGWVYKPDARYTSYYLGKGVFWSPVKWLQVWGGSSASTRTSTTPATCWRSAPSAAPSSWG